MTSNSQDVGFGDVNVAFRHAGIFVRYCTVVMGEETWMSVNKRKRSDYDFVIAIDNQQMTSDCSGEHATLKIGSIIPHDLAPTSGPPLPFIPMYTVLPLEMQRTRDSHHALGI
jgi:hypothetical protein